MNSVEEKEFYEKIGKINGWNFSKMKYDLADNSEFIYFDEVNNNVNKNTILLDIGTGGGEKLINNISNDCLLKIGTDFSDEMIKVSKRNIGDRDNIKVLKVKDEKMISMIGISKNNCDKRIILNLDMTEEQLKEECLQNSTPIEEEAIKKYIPKDIRDIYKDKLEQGNIQTCLEILYLTDRVLKNKHNNQEKIKTLKINITK